MITVVVLLYIDETKLNIINKR